MSRLIDALVLGIVALVVLAASATAISRLLSAVVPLVLVVGIVAIALKFTDYYTRR